MACNRQSVKLLEAPIPPLPVGIGMLTAHMKPDSMPESAGERLLL